MFFPRMLITCDRRLQLSEAAGRCKANVFFHRLSNVTSICTINGCFTVDSGFRDSRSYSVAQRQFVLSSVENRLTLSAVELRGRERFYSMMRWFRYPCISCVACPRCAGWTTKPTRVNLKPTVEPSSHNISGIRKRELLCAISISRLNVLLNYHFTTQHLLFSVIIRNM